MKKFLILWAVFCLTVNTGMAQCPESGCPFAANHWLNKVRICMYQNDGYKYKISETAVVGQTVTFEATGIMSFDFSNVTFRLAWCSP